MNTCNILLFVLFFLQYFTLQGNESKSMQSLPNQINSVSNQIAHLSSIFFSSCLQITHFDISFHIQQKYLSTGNHSLTSQPKRIKKKRRAYMSREGETFLISLFIPHYCSPISTLPLLLFFDIFLILKIVKIPKRNVGSWIRSQKTKKKDS